MTISKIIYKDAPDILARYYLPKSGEFLEYKSKIIIKDSGKMPITLELKFDGTYPSFAPMPPEEHLIRAKDIIDLFLKLKRWFGKYGYEIK